MKYLLALMLLVVLPASAEWMQIAESTSGNVFLIDPASIKKEGNIRKVWGITNRASPDSYGVSSRKYRKEFDCSRERYRFLTNTSYTKPMGYGVALLTDSNAGQWVDIAPDTVDEELLKVICSK
jgi:hypothetical protein